MAACYAADDLRAMATGMLLAAGMDARFAHDVADVLDVAVERFLSWE